MRICIDLDGVICETKNPSQTYADVKPLPGAVEKIKALKKTGHYIIILSARNMKTAGGDVNQVLARVGEITLAWLREHEVPYDEVNFGKPYAHVYIDDKAYRFSGWRNIDRLGKKLPLKPEDKNEY